MNNVTTYCRIRRYESNCNQLTNQSVYVFEIDTRIPELNEIIINYKN